MFESVQVHQSHSSYTVTSQAEDYGRKLNSGSEKIWHVNDALMISNLKTFFCLTCDNFVLLRAADVTCLLKV